MTQEMNLGGGGSSAFQFSAATPRCRGRIVEFTTVPQTHYEGPQKGEPRFFPDGKPMTQVRVELQTAYRNSEGLKVARPAGTDDGMRAVYLKANKSPDTTSTMQAVIAAATAVCGKGAIHIGGDLELIYEGDVKSHTGQLAGKYSASYGMPSTDLAPAAPAAVPAPPAAPAVPTPPPLAAVPAAPVAAPVQASAPAAPAPSDPLLANLSPAQLAVLGQAPAAVPPPPAAVPAPPVAVPPPPAPAVKTTPEGLTLEQLVTGGWTREQALAVYPMLG